MTYGVHIKGSAELIDIGEFPNADEANNWAKLRYGQDLESVTPILTTQATAIDPLWILVALLALALVTKKKGS